MRVEAPPGNEGLAAGDFGSKGEGQIVGEPVGEVARAIKGTSEGGMIEVLSGSGRRRGFKEAHTPGTLE